MENLMINGHEYTIGRLNALDQLHVSRKIAPVVPTLMPIISEIAKGDLEKTIQAIEAGNNEELSGLEPLTEALAPLMDAFAGMPEDDVNYITYKCLSVVKRDGSIVCRGQSLMFDDIELGEMFPLVIAVIRINLGNFIRGLLTKASSIKATQ